jgi:NitT/TauT family transport system permease protein
VTLPPTLARVLPDRTWPFLTDLTIFGAVLAAFYGMLTILKYWSGGPTPEANISLSLSALPSYAFFSVVRLFLAYALSLVFALGYGYIAANNPRAEKIMIPVLDILQSIPVLSFLPGVMLAMIALIPGHQLGVELGSILLIFTGQVWNMAFSFYSSLKSIPKELREASRIYGFNRWHCFLELDLPYGTIGLVWNSMVSVAGGWFFLMACEMFQLGKRDFRLPGLGSFLQTAASAGDTKAILLGLTTMVLVIVLIDQLLWRPVIAWADKFKFEQTESSDLPRSPILAFLRQSRALAFVQRKTSEPLVERLCRGSHAGKKHPLEATGRAPRTWAAKLIAVAGAALILYALVRSGMLLRDLTPADLVQTLKGAGATFLRVNVALLIAALWTIPAGVAIGFHPKLARLAQPLAQIAASVPATALFPIILLGLIRLGGGLGIASILLMLLGTQWYILFNVIAGAIAIPSDLKEAALIFRFDARERWLTLILPGIFPYLVTGMVTASGGAWNASIVAEYFRFSDKLFTTLGLGAQISAATDAGRFSVLLLSTIVMATIVVSINRLVWRPMYRLAETRYRLET